MLYKIKFSKINNDNPKLCTSSLADYLVNLFVKSNTNHFIIGYRITVKVFKGRNFFLNL